MPFKGDYEASIIYSILHEQPKPVAEFDVELPEAVQTIIDRSLAKEKESRYKSVTEISTDLAALANHRDLENPLSDSGSSGSVEELLQHRQNIDRLIESKYKRPIVILFTDIVGSTQYFEQRGDIEGRAMLSRHHQVMFPIIEKYKGAIIKTMGDSIMASYEDVAAACSCAREMQRTLFRENQKMAPEDQITIRIALHFGKAVIEKNDVFGDAVNVASRVEKLTDGNQIMLSQAVVDALQDNPEYQVVHVGSVTMKGKSEKMSLFRLQWFDDEVIQPIPVYDSEIAEQPTPLPAVKAGTIVIKEPYKLLFPKREKSEALSPELKNPYMNRVMIQEINEFYGRKNEVEKIYSRIGSSRPQSISIVGERRIGKSSLLNFINQAINRKKYLANPDEYVFVFVDFQERRGIEIRDFFSILFEELLSAFQGNLEINVEPNYEGFKKVVSTFDEHKLKLILLFDEFELITKNTNFDAEFYSFCRSIANNFNVAYIVSSGRNLQTLCHSRQISDSPFFNIFSNLTLSQFNRAEAVALITGPAEKLNYSLQPYIDLIIDIAGYYPFFIQIACAALFEILKNSTLGNKALEDTIKDEYIDEAKVHFQQIWESADQDQKEIILALCSGKKVQPNQEYLIKVLEKQGYVKPGKKRPEIFSSIFAEYIFNRYGSSVKSKNPIWPFANTSRRKTG
jgi:class 3 adenylate cyclase/AAA+ ATPase superfamily predicted ATPase